jgi:hypothetical protein
MAKAISIVHETGPNVQVECASELVATIAKVEQTDPFELLALSKTIVLAVQQLSKTPSLREDWHLRSLE